MALRFHKATTNRTWIEQLAKLNLLADSWMGKSLSSDPPLSPQAGHLVAMAEANQYDVTFRADSSGCCTQIASAPSESWQEPRWVSWSLAQFAFACRPSFPMHKEGRICPKMLSGSDEDRRWGLRGTGQEKIDRRTIEIFLDKFNISVSRSQVSIENEHFTSGLPPSCCGMSYSSRMLASKTTYACDAARVVLVSTSS